MEKTIINLENIIAASLLKFGRVDKTDILLIAEELLKDSSLDVEMDKINCYVESTDEVISLKDGLDMNSFTENERLSIESILKKASKSSVTRFLDSIDIDDYVLLKMSRYSVIHLEDKDKLFSKSQVESLVRLIDEGYLWVTWNDFIPHEDYQQISLTQKGDKRVFEHVNKEELEEFKKSLNDSKYDVTLMDDFLMTQKLNRDVHTILSIDNFTRFCNDYDRALYASGERNQVLIKK